VLKCVALCCSVLQCVAVCCSVLQCVAVCCSVLQCVAINDIVLQYDNTYETDVHTLMAVKLPTRVKMTRKE